MSRRLPPLATCCVGLLVLACHLVPPISCGWFGLSREEVLAKLRGQPLSSDRVLDILRGAKDSSWPVDSFSIAELRSLHEFTLDKCAAEELDRRHSIVVRPLQDKANENVHRYAGAQYSQFVIFCARNADKVFRRHIIEIGAQVRQDLSYFKAGVLANQKSGPGSDLVKSMEEYLAKSKYVNDRYKEIIATGCKTVNENLRNIVAIREHAKQLDQPLNLNYSMWEWLLLNDYCKLYNDKFANK